MTSLILISLGILLIWISSEKLERYSILSAKKLRISPFLIGSTVIAFGTSSPEILTSFFAALENRGAMVVGNVVGSNIANLSLVFGSTILILGLKKKLSFTLEESILVTSIIEASYKSASKGKKYYLT